MRRLLVFAFVGLIAQLVDGSLGMAYGVTSTTLLLTAGIAPAVASASVHLAEVGTTLTSGISHWRLGNVDWAMFLRLTLPGGVGAFLGAVVLSSLSAELARPWIAAFLLALGIYIIARFALARNTQPTSSKPISGRFLAPLGLGAGFLDAAGGGWGPIATPTLLASNRVEPRRVIGTVDTSEFLVAVCASLGFLISMDTSTIAFPVVGALLVGGVIAAPLAAWLVRYLHPRVLGTAVGGIILLTNGRTILHALGVGTSGVVAASAIVAVAWLTLLSLVIIGLFRDGETRVLTARRAEDQSR